MLTSLATAAFAQTDLPPAPVPPPTPAASREVRLALPADPLYDEGTRALDEGLPEVAAYKLRAFLQTSPAPAAHHAATLALARALLATADPSGALTLLDAEPLTSPAADAELDFWRAQAQAALGRWTDALAGYTRVAQASPRPPGDLAPCARFGRAEGLLALGQSAEAAAAFKTLCDDPVLGERARLRDAEIELDRWHAKPDGGHLREAASALTDPHAPGLPPLPGAPGSARLLAQEHAYLLGRLRLAQHQPAAAEQIFQASLAHPEGLSERLMVDDYWGWAHACLDEDGLDRAEDALETLVERHPESAFIGPTLTWLEALYRRSPPSDFSVLHRWSEDETKPAREAPARLALARLDAAAGRNEQAEELLAGFEAAFPAQPLRVRAWLDLAGLRLRLGRSDAARDALERARRLAPEAGSAAAADLPPAAAWRTEIEALDARISLAQHDDVHAAERFDALAARLGAGQPAEAAAFNAVLGWLHAGDMDRFAADERAFAARFPHSALHAEFALEEGLARAAQTPAGDAAGRERASDCLRAFLTDHPLHPRAAEAHLALAELAFAGSSPDLDDARRELAAADLRPAANDAPGGPPGQPDPATRDRADYLAIWLADAPGPARDADKAVALARKFLADRPASPLATEARMKLGEIYFQRADYPDAQTQLELLAKNAPSSPLAEAALYLAGMSARLSMSASGLDSAVGLFEQAAQRGGPFKLPARLQQAEVQNQLDRGRDALILYDGVLTATAGRALSDAELDSRCAALCGRGKTLLAMGGTAAGGPDFYRDAVGAFDQLATGTPGASLLWRRQALTLKGNALEKLGEPDAALAAYDDALNAAEPPSAAEPNAPEWTWFYRAGSDAARLLEARAQWASAIAVYRKLASADGLMKGEFENALKRLQLEHFIWPE